MRRLFPLFLLAALLAGCSPLDTPTLPPSAATAEAPSAAARPSAATSASASAQPPANTQSSGAVTVSFAVWDYERPIYDGLAKSFMAQNPNINIVLVPLEDLTNSENQTGAESPEVQLRRVVSGADTAPASFAQPSAYGTKLLYNLKPLMDADPDFKRDDFYPGTIERYTTKAGVWVLPRYFYVQLLDYNKDLFKQNNLPEPKPGWSWNDLLATAEKLAKKDGSSTSTYGYFDWSNGFLPLVTMLQAQGIDLASMNPQQVQLDRPEIVAAVTHFRDLVQRGVLFQPENKPDTPPVDVPQIIHDGKIGIWQSDVLQSASATGQPSTPPSFTVGMVPYPATQVAIDDVGGNTDGYIISGGTAYPNEAWKWIEFLSRRQTDQPDTNNGDDSSGRIPARQSVAEQTGFWQSMDDATAAAYKAAIQTPLNAPSQPSDPTASGVVFSSLQQAFFQIASNPAADPQKVLTLAQKDLQTQLAQIQLTPQPTPDTSQVVVATPEAQEAPAGGTTITFSAMGYSAPALRQLARAFRQQYPNIFVQISSTDTFTGPVTLQDLTRINDCFAWASPPQSPAEFAALLNLQPLLDADATFPKNDFLPAVRAPYQHENGLYGLPYAFNMRSINYNRALLDKAGIQPPSVTWKPEDFLRAAQALTSGDGDAKQYGYVPLGDPQQDMLFFIGQFGGQLTTGSGASLRPTFDDPKVATALQWYLDLAKVYKVTPPLQFVYKNGDQSSTDQSYNLIQSGRAAMWLDYGIGTFVNSTPPNNSNQPLNFEVGVAPLPVGAAGLHTSDLSPRGLLISAQSQHPQACWEWIKYMSQDTSGLNGDLPARVSIAASDAFAKQAPPSMVTLYQAYGDTLKQASTPSASLDTFYQMDTYWFFKAVSEANAGSVDLRTGLATAQKLTTAFMECMAKANTPATCAKSVDASYQGSNTQDPQP